MKSYIERQLWKIKNRKLIYLFCEISSDFNSKFFSSQEAKICELHELLDQGENHHNCIACNLASNYLLIKRHLEHPSKFHNLEYTFSSTIMMYYLLVEKFFAIFKSIEGAGLQPEGYKNSHQTMRLIWHWANFLKHPKAFMYVHDPTYFNVSKFALKEVENDSSDDSTPTTTVSAFIDDDFVRKFYGGSGNNTELFNKLKNKSDVIVVFPDFKEINTGLHREIKEFETLLQSNPTIVSHLHNEATILEFWNED